MTPARRFSFLSSRRRHTRWSVTGVQTCALPILAEGLGRRLPERPGFDHCTAGRRPGFHHRTAGSRRARGTGCLGVGCGSTPRRRRATKRERAAGGPKTSGTGTAFTRRHRYSTSIGTQSSWSSGGRRCSFVDLHGFPVGGRSHIARSNDLPYRPGEGIHVVLGGVPGAHPANFGSALVPDVEGKAFL